MRPSPNNFRLRVQVLLFIIALGSVSFALYAILVLRRRTVAPETEEALADQTAVVFRGHEHAQPVPELAAHPTGAVQPADSLHRPWRLPTVLGCTVATDRFARWLDAEQWNSYGWQYIDALPTKRSCQTSRLTAWSPLTERTGTSSSNSTCRWSNVAGCKNTSTS